MIGRPEVDPRTCEPTRGVAMLHILKHPRAERQSRYVETAREVDLRPNRLLESDLAERRDMLARNDSRRFR
jgi:hypothetical protein